MNRICEIETRRGREMRANLAQALWCWSQRCGEKQPMPSPFARLTSLLYCHERAVEMFLSSNRIEVRHPTLQSQQCGTRDLFWMWRMPMAVACDPWAGQPYKKKTLLDIWTVMPRKTYFYIILSFHVIRLTQEQYMFIPSPIKKKWYIAVWKMMYYMNMFVNLNRTSDTCKKNTLFIS